MGINNYDWKPFAIEEICNIYSGCDIYDAERIEGDIPYITSSALNNGIKYFVANQNDTLEDNAISVNRNGSVGYAFYHKYFALYSNDCRKLKLKEHNNEAVSLFITSQIMCQKEKFNYGYKLGTGRLKRQNIMLPVDADEKPDYAYMERYINSLITDKKQKYLEYVKQQLLELTYCSIEKIDEKEWREFCIDDIFIISAGKRLEKHNMTAGETPFIGATDSGNGITNYVSNKNESLDKNVLGVNYNGNGVAIAFYHPYECLFTDDVKRFHLKNGNDNAYIFLFLKTIILQQKSKFSYGYKFNGKRMTRQYLLLPVDDEGNPDYDYMEQYTKNLMIKKYKQYLRYIKKEPF